MLAPFMEEPDGRLKARTVARQHSSAQEEPAPVIDGRVCRVSGVRIVADDSEVAPIGFRLPCLIGQEIGDRLVDGRDGIDLASIQG